MDKKEYDQIEERANKLQTEAERRCGQKIKETKEYRDGYVQAIEDLLTEEQPEEQPEGWKARMLEKFQKRV